MKKLLILTVAGFLTFGTYSTIFANDVMNDKIVHNSASITPFIDVIKGDSVSIKDSTYTSSKFDIPSSATYFNVDFKNTSNTDVKVKVYNSSNTLIKSFTVESGSQDYGQLSNRTGKFYVQIDRVGGGTGITGTLRVAYYE